MSKILFLNLPAYGHVNPTLGLVEALVDRGEEVIYFCSEEFRHRVEETGALFKGYRENYFLKQKNKAIGNNGFYLYINKILTSCEKVIEDILFQIKGIKIDYIIYDSTFTYGSIIADILGIPSISSFAIFATSKELMSKNSSFINSELINHLNELDAYKETASKLKETYNIELPKISDMFFSKSDINIVYTSKYFISHAEFYDDSYKFIGPSICKSSMNLHFPFEKLEGKKVIYITLGTVFNNSDTRLYDIFFEAFGKEENVVVVMTAYNLDISEFNIPDNFIVKHFVPQSEILKYTHVAITHAGMNSTSELICNGIPFVAIPIEADQPYIAARVSELGAAISLKKNELTSEILKNSVEMVLKDSSYLKNMKKIYDSFKESGGFNRAIEEIFEFKRDKGIN
ncbi:MAG: glycosyltransferase [Bacillota bacterium]|nr:glycosyltransferase [Bacillota bacterium]